MINQKSAGGLDSISGTEYGEVFDLIDTSRYPVHQPDSKKYKELVSDCLEQMKSNGYCLLQGFMKEEALELMVREAREIAPFAFHNTLTGNAYLTPQDPDLDEDDVRRIEDTTALGAVAYDQVPTGSALRRLYEWDGLMEFLADALGYERLYRYDDHLGALNLAVMKEGDHLRWHFDQTDFVVSLLIQDCLAGGKYEVYPKTRSAEEENFDLVKDIVKNNRREGILTLDIKPGCLVLFKGRHSLHRVTTVKGDVDRLIALFGYDTSSGVCGSDYLKMIRYGRIK